MRVRILLSAAIAYLVCLPILGRDATIPRRTVVFFRYVGGDTGDAKRALDNFRHYAGVQLESLTEPIEVVLIDASVPPMGARNDYQEKAAALTLARGSVFGIAPDFTIANQLFLGNLKGSLDRMDIAINVPFSILRAPAGKDAFFAAALFALAMDEQRGQLKPDHIIAHLAEALSTINDAERRNGSLTDDLNRLRDAVVLSLHTLTRK